MSQTQLLVGTRKGAFLCISDDDRRSWRVEGPYLKGWEVLDLAVDRRGGETAVWAALSHVVWGSTVQVSRDGGRSWEQIEDGPAFAEDAGRKLRAVWTVEPGRSSEAGVLWAGVADAGLFRSDDAGASWREVPGLNDHPTRGEWQPGAGGLCCHTIIADPTRPERMWVGISAVGVFRSDDGGATWQPRNEGVPAVVPSQTSPEIGRCVHKLVQAPGEPDLLYQQNHVGVFRSRDAGDSWERIENGLPCSFGFPMAVHPGDGRRLWVVPLESDEHRVFPDGRAAVYASADGGDSWQARGDGLPDGPCYTGVLRHAMAADGLDPCGLYFGTTGGQLFASRDQGTSWQALPALLPRIASVTAVVAG